MLLINIRGIGDYLKKQLDIGRMYTQMVKENIPIIIQKYVWLSLLGPNREPECDAAIASLVEMGFSEVNFFLSNNILINFLFLQGKISFSIINGTLEHQWCTWKFMQRMNNFSQTILIDILLLWFLVCLYVYLFFYFDSLNIHVRFV